MRFGVLCNNDKLQKWQLETIQHLISGGHTCLLLIEDGNQYPVPTFIEKLIHYPYSKLFVRLWFRYLMKPDAKEIVSFADLNFNIPKLECITLKKGFAQYFSDSDVENIKSCQLDFILRFGFGIIKGKILAAAKYGIWSYHHDDDRKYRGVPTGFWEIMFGDPVNAAILQQLTEKLDSGVILHKAYFATINHSWEANFNNLLKSSTEWPLQVCKRIENGDTSFLKASNEPGSAIYKLPGNLQMVKFGLILLRNKIRFHLRDLFITEKWNIGILKSDKKDFVKDEVLNLAEPHWLSLSSKRSVYHADPFCVLIDGTIHLICEEYDYARTKGILVSFQFDGLTFELKKKNIALEKEYHLAYPYFFISGENYYCVPENSRSGNVDLFRYNPETGHLHFEHTLIKDLTAVDPTLFNFNGKWWLFFTDTVSTNERLHIWYSDDLKGVYHPHANNPVKVDIRSSRPAGTPFVSQNELYRPAQDCSARSGRRISINRITRLSPTDFEEEVCSVINPNSKSDWKMGMHTLCVTDGYSIIDGKKEYFICQAFTRKIKAKIYRLFKITL